MAQLAPPSLLRIRSAGGGPSELLAWPGTILIPLPFARQWKRSRGFWAESVAVARA